nr:MAG TPA: NrdH [Caudoviricetes sp.]
MNIILYTQGCPKCKILEAKLNKKNIKYQEFTDVDKMLDMGIKSVPYLKVDGKLMDFTEANDWVNKQ